MSRLDTHVEKDSTLLGLLQGLRLSSVRTHTFAKPIPHAIVVDASLPRGVAALSSDDQKAYKKHSHLCTRTDRALAKAITDTISVRNERLDWLEKCENSGLQLIPLLFAKRAEIGPIANNAASTKIAAGGAHPSWPR